jgi:primosomal protein N'
VGVHRGGRRPGFGRRALTTTSHPARIARIVPAVPSFSVDAGFRYLVPEPLRLRVDTGSVVRVPLGGRRVKGYVIGIEDGEAGGLREIAQVSGRSTVFDQIHLQALRWCATHYVAPLSVVLERTVPPNNPPGPPGGDAEGGSGPAGSRSRESGRPAVWLTARVDPERIIGVTGDALAAGFGSLVVVPTAAEAIELSERLAVALGPAHQVVHGEMSAREVTDAWNHARHRPVVLVGTPRVAAWAIHRPAMAIVIEESRRAMKDRQTPTVHARDLLRARASTERFGLVFAGPTPSVEVIAGGPTIEAAPRRLWSLVEVVDRGSEPPGGGLLTDPARQAVRSVTAQHGRTFVFAHRRGYAAAVRCVSCRTMRRCQACGSRPDPGTVCSRCGAAVGACVACGANRFEPLGAGVGRLVEEIGRVVGHDRVGEFPFDGPVSVGTERDLAAVGAFDLVVFTDVDGILFGTSFRAAEECLRIGARLAGAVRPGSGHRLLIQTSEPGHPVITALRRADPLPALQGEAELRASLGYPPAGELLVLELRGAVDVASVGAELEAASHRAAIMGPATGPDGHRWLVQGNDLSAFRVSLRPIVQRWRDAGAIVRIDADPIDL